MPTDLTKFGIPPQQGSVLNSNGSFSYDWWMFLQGLQTAVPAEGAGGVSQVGINQLTGDVTAGPGTGSQVATISNNAVTYAKMQDISAASRLLGRGSAAGAGDPQEITLGSGLTMTGTTLAASGSGGTVTHTGNLTANELVVGNGTADIKVIAATDGQIPIGKTSDGSVNLATITAGSNITVTNGAGSITIAATGGGSGTVTNTGALTNHALIKGNGGVDVSALGSLGTTTTVLHGNASGDPSFSAVDLANDVTGNLAVSHLDSGTSASSSTFWRGDGTWAAATASGNDYVVLSNGANPPTPVDDGAGNFVYVVYTP